MKINKSYIIAGTLLLLIALWFALRNTGVLQSDPAPAAPSGRTADTVPSVVFEYRTAEEHDNLLSLYGSTEAPREVEVKAQTAGAITSTPISEGRKVSKGTLLCRQDVDARQAMLDQANANLRVAEIDLNAARVLADKGFQSATRVTALEAQIDGAQAAIKQAEVELNNINIRAPFTGIWEQQISELGDYLAPGQPCGLLVELSPLLVRAELTENQVGKIKAGQSAQVSLATGETITGRVRMIESKANPATRTFRMEIEIPNDDYALKSGVTADVKVSAGKVMAQHIPSQILSLSDDGTVGVRYLYDDDTVAFTAVETVDEDARGVWVTGLPERTRIITKGQDYVAVGTKVTPALATTLTQRN